MNSIFHRVSIRRYTDEPVSEEHIEQLLRAAMAAPSACNQQPWEFYVVTDPDTIARLGKATRFAQPAGRAKLVIVPCLREACVAPRMAPQDLSAATENILLEADSLGLGTCWMGVYGMANCVTNVREILAVPEEVSPFALISVGHPAEERPQQDRYDPARIHRV